MAPQGFHLSVRQETDHTASPVQKLLGNKDSEIYSRIKR
jgi:hypothetical protein